MADYGVKFNGAGHANIEVWSAPSDFNISILFKTPNILTTKGLTGNVGSDSFIAVFADGSMQMAIGSSINHQTATGLLVPNTEYLLETVRASTTTSFKLTRTSDSAVITDETPISSNATLSFTRIGDTQGLFFDGQINQIILNASGDVRNYLSRVNTGNTWSDLGNGAKDAALVGLATDGSQWVLFGEVVVGGGAITTEPLKNNSGQLLSLVSNINIVVYNPADNELVFQQTGLTTDVNGVLVITNAAIAVDVEYRVVVSIGADDGIARYTAV
mgnify:CR=1 FL=1